VLTKSHVVNLEIHFTTGKCVVKVRPETSGTHLYNTLASGDQRYGASGDQRYAGKR